MPRVPGLDKPVGAFLLFLALTLATTWPLALGLARDVPGDLGDPLLNSWIIAWNADRVLRLLSGDVAAFAQLWHGNIFYPAQYALAYSELLHAQGLQALPVYALTRNPILCYNLVFLSTFVLSALGMYLFVRELTGDWRAGLVAGLAYGFLPYRIDQLPHLQTLSSQWMPFALYGFRRYFTTGRLRPLAGAALALIAQNLSCGYFLIYFSLFVPPYVLWEMATRGRLLDARTWRDIGAAAVGVALVTLPAMYPYFALRETEGIKRSIEEARVFSADLLGFVTASDRLVLWAWLQALPKAEGAIFLGATGAVLSLVAAPFCIGDARRDAAAAIARERHVAHARPWPRLRKRAVVIALVAALASLAAVVFFLVAGPQRFDLGFGEIKLLSLRRPFRVLGISTCLVLLLSPRLRLTAAAFARRPFFFFAACTLVAAWLALGPGVHVRGVELGSSIFYTKLFNAVPGFDGLRVPARYAMVAGCFLAVMAGLAAHALLSRWPRHAGWLTAVMAVAAFADGAVKPPFFMNGAMHAGHGLNHPPPAVATGAMAPAVYREVARLPDEAVIVELPLGDVAWDVRATFYSTQHWKRVVNGFSGYWPKAYGRRVAFLLRPADEPEHAWEELTGPGTTHVVLHRGAYSAETAGATADWLLAHGARLAWTDGSTDLFALP